MRNLLKLTTVALFMLMFTAVKADGDEPRLVFEVKEDVKSMVFELDTPSEQAALKFSDLQGHVLFAEDITKRAGYIKRFNLKELPEGTYSLTTDNVIRTIVYTIAVEEGNASLINKKIMLKPVYSNKENKVYVRIPQTNGKKVYVSIYNEKGEVIREERFKEGSGITKVYNFTDAAKGTYSVRVWNSNGIYMNSIEVK